MGNRVIGSRGAKGKRIHNRFWESKGIELEMGKWGTNNFFDRKSTHCEGFDPL